MALLKAFVLQVVLFGLYKLFLEQVVEQHLVPDELTRNCLVGLVGLLCFGIQLYTEKLADDEYAEVEENPKSKSRETSATTKSESAGISMTSETVATYTSPVTVGKSETMLREIATEKQMPSKERKAEMITEVRHSNPFAEFSPNVSCTIPKVDTDVGMEELKVPSSASQTSTPTPVINGFSETNDHEESDEDAIEIDNFEAREQCITEAKLVQQIQSEETNGLRTIEVDLVKQSRIAEVKATQTESKEGEEIQQKYVTETIRESECSSVNGDDIPAEDSEQNGTLNIGKSSEVINGVFEESLNINNVSNVIESKEPVTDEGEIRTVQERILSSKLDESGSDVKEFKTSALETNSTSTEAEKDIETTSKNHCTETSTLVKQISSSSNKLTVASTIQKVTAAAEDVCVAPLLIDISFIYACH